MHRGLPEQTFAAAASQVVLTESYSGNNLFLKMILTLFNSRPVTFQTSPFNWFCYHIRPIRIGLYEPLLRTSYVFVRLVINILEESTLKIYTFSCDLCSYRLFSRINTSHCDCHSEMLIMIMMVWSAIYSQQMGEDSHGGLSCNVLAIRVLPSLIPLAVSPALNISQVSSNRHCFKLSLAALLTEHDIKLFDNVIQNLFNEISWHGHCLNIVRLQLEEKKSSRYLFAYLLTYLNFCGKGSLSSLIRYKSC